MTDRTHSDESEGPCERCGDEGVIRVGGYVVLYPGLLSMENPGSERICPDCGGEG